jgi:hypothetical protein
MSKYTIIAGVGETLVGVLLAEMPSANDVNLRDIIKDKSNISLESPFDLEEGQEANARLSVYLYRVAEDAVSKNQFPVPGNGNRLRPPPLVLDLYYLITPRLGTARDHHIVLGKVLQVFYDRAILEGGDLAGLIAGADLQLRVILNTVTLEETTRVWQAMEMSYRLSVCYLVRVVPIDSQREEFSQPVVSRTNTYGQP